MHGVRPDGRQQPIRRRVVDRDNQNAVVVLDDITVDGMRAMLAEHIVTVWDDQNAWARGAIRMHIDVEARAYLQLGADVGIGAVRDAYCDAIRGVNGRERLFADLGCQLAFASRFKCCILCFIPPRQSPRNPGRNILYRPLMFGSHATAAAAGERENRTSCLMMMYVLQDGVGHAEPLRARTSGEGRPSRFTGVCDAVHFVAAHGQGACMAVQSTCRGTENHHNVQWHAGLDFGRAREQNYCPATNTVLGVADRPPEVQVRVPTSLMHSIAYLHRTIPNIQ
jgi:hypothetical protein